ncbi:LOW QUALITY PROTEIN: HHLA3 isoform 6 [Pongo abelii]|uniref:HHLA3 isoform 2 n=1 Tax=Pongo abelii TaxID=9601 RepID=A0A2J8WQ08_PONAB|nr:LOW QUALITY PROTEIN: HHLA3 isoform 2 [Pongo abelii]PNJ71839.1 LOW QUALITY PROTEIN: HHLA3 isoform 6 [Pongo abelii]
MFGACCKQPLKPSGSEPPAEECRMTPRHAGCDVTEMHRILSTFTEHLLRAICTKLANMYSTSTDCKEHCRRRVTAKQLKAEAGRSCQRKGVPIQTPRERSWISCKKEFEANP